MREDAHLAECAFALLVESAQAETAHMAGPVIARPQDPVPNRLGADVAELLLCLCLCLFLVFFAVLLAILGNLGRLQPPGRRVEQGGRSSSASRDGSYLATGIRL